MLMCCRARKRRVVSQFEDLQNCYMKLRRGESGALSAPQRPSLAGTADTNAAQPPGRLQIASGGEDHIAHIAHGAALRQNHTF